MLSIYRLDRALESARRPGRPERRRRRDLTDWGQLYHAVGGDGAINVIQRQLLRVRRAPVACRLGVVVPATRRVAHTGQDEPIDIA